MDLREQCKLNKNAVHEPFKATCCYLAVDQDYAIAYALMSVEKESSCMLIMITDCKKTKGSQQNYLC